MVSYLGGIINVSINSLLIHQQFVFSFLNQKYFDQFENIAEQIYSGLRIYLNEDISRLKI